MKAYVGFCVVLRRRWIKDKQSIANLAGQRLAAKLHGVKARRLIKNRLQWNRCKDNKSKAWHEKNNRAWQSFEKGLMQAAKEFFFLYTSEARSHFKNMRG